MCPTHLCRAQKDAPHFLLPGIDTVRTSKKRRINKKAAERFLRDFVAPIDLEPRRDEILANIKKLQEMFDPQEEVQKAA